MSILKRNLFGIQIDAINMQGAVAQLRRWVEESGSQSGCRYVVTPNVDHAVLLQENEKFRQAYDGADLILADGHPIVWASRLLRQPLPERVPGSELVPELFNAYNQSGKLRVFLLGAAEGVAARAAENMKRKWPNVETVGVYSPPLGFEHSATESNNILDRIATCQPDVVVVGLGAPKQELWIHQYHDQIQARVALCVGATIDFLAGEKNEHHAGCSKQGSNGCIECAASQKEWSSVTQRMPGSSLNLSGNNGSDGQIGLLANNLIQ